MEETSLPAIFRNCNEKKHIERPDLIQRSLILIKFLKIAPVWWSVKILQGAMFSFRLSAYIGTHDWATRRSVDWSRLTRKDSYIQPYMTLIRNVRIMQIKSNVKCAFQSKT